MGIRMCMGNHEDAIKIYNYTVACNTVSGIMSLPLAKYALFLTHWKFYFHDL